jgi:hypothetical protein
MRIWINGMNIICVICWKVDHAPFTYILARDQLKVGKMKKIASLFLSCNFAYVVNMNTIMTI